MTDAEPFLDTNVFVRHLTGDHPTQSPRCRDLLADIEQGTRRAWTSHLVVAEIVFVLMGLYRFDRGRLASAVLPLLELPGLRIQNRRVFRRAFELFEGTRLSYPDCYHAALIEQRPDPSLVSFDRGFDAIPALRRSES